jgi:serine/threonine protein phosphatase PrpC
MLKKKLGKKIIEMESFFEEVLVCNDKKNRPFLEVFVHEPENIAQKDLGALLGIFEINDDSEDSSYIVNYLISVIKKEYFSRPRRGSVESFEAALHKANLALAKLAEYGNINWIGKINALCAVTEKQNLHLTQTGSTLALLLRNGYLTNISEDLSPDNLEPNPLKTFVNISSGKLENRDKLVIITDNILDILDLEEIKNNALNFSEKDFVQFLRTVLANKLEKAAALIVDVK